MVARPCSPSYSGGWGRRIAWTQEAEVTVAEIMLLQLQLGDKNKTLSQNKTKQNKNCWVDIYKKDDVLSILFYLT